MAEYIEREAALRVLCDACGNAACPKGLIPRCSYYEKMQSIPTADVRPVVRATWEKVMEQPYFRKHYHVVACSACHKRGNQGWRYCPNCGAVMEES